jgi:integrase
VPCIRAEGGKLRGRANRTVPLAANVVEWLTRYPPGERGSLPYLSKRAWQTLRLLAVKKLKGRPLKWVADIARHTFISYRLVVEPDEAVVAREAGNSPDEIYASYHHLKMPAQSAAFWGIRPG